jgi:hypothetical protein
MPAGKGLLVIRIMRHHQTKWGYCQSQFVLVSWSQFCVYQTIVLARPRWFLNVKNNGARGRGFGAKMPWGQMEAHRLLCAKGGRLRSVHLTSKAVDHKQNEKIRRSIAHVSAAPHSS